MTMYEQLLSPVKVGGLELPNRVVMLPMGIGMSAHDGRSTPEEAAYYAERARGGTGLLITGATFVTDDFEVLSPTLARITTDDHIPGYRAMADAVHHVGGRVSLQISAGQGRNGPLDPSGAKPTRSASDNPTFADPAIRCVPLQTAEVELLVQRFGDAARRAAEAGMDALDLHGHTGYLIDQFLSPQWNRRTDRYGGSVENRCRLVSEIVAAVKASAPGLPVSFRLTVHHRYPGGRTWEDTRDIVPHLVAAGIDLILCDDGSYEAMDYVFPPYYLGDDCMAHSAELVKALVDIPVAACGNITPASGEALLVRGATDLIGIGRGLIAEPHFVTKLAAGRSDRVRPCIRCNVGCVGSLFAGGHIGCSVNTQAGFETERIIRPAAVPKKVVVVGAGPGGLEAARVAGLRGHTVDVFEASAQPGGVLVPAAAADFKTELRRMVEWWSAELAELPNVTVHTNTTIRADSDELAHADALVVATGSVPLLPAIPGIERANVVDVLAFHTGTPVGRRVVVCGGGLSGADAALEMAENGHEVVIVEMLDDIARDMLAINRITLTALLAEHGVRVLTSHKVKAITPAGVVAQGPRGEVTIETDSVVTAFGVRPADDLAQALTALGIGYVKVGDCVEPRKVGDAIREGFLAAMAL